MSKDYNLKIKNLAWNFVIYRIGETYWLTNPKVATRFLTNFSQIRGTNEAYSFTAHPYVEIQHKNISIVDPHYTYEGNESTGLIVGTKHKWKIKGVDYIGKGLSSDNIEDILKKTTHTIIRNPIERLKSGIIQMFVEWFFETQKYYLKNELWEHVNLFENYNKQNEYDINWDEFFNPFDEDRLNKLVLNLDIINRNTDKIKSSWKLEWSKFTNLFLNDVIKTKYFEHNVDKNVHTQSYLYTQYHFLHDIQLYNNIEVVDLGELNSYRETLLKNIPHRQNLEEYFSNPRIKESNDVFKDINWNTLYQWIENSKIYAHEIHAYYDMLGHK